MASFLNNWEDASSDAGVRSPTRPFTQEKLNPILDIPASMTSEPDSEPPPPAPPPMDIEADFTVGEMYNFVTCVKPNKPFEFYLHHDVMYVSKSLVGVKVLHLRKKEQVVILNIVVLLWCALSHVSCGVVVRNSGEDGAVERAGPAISQPFTCRSTKTTSSQESPRKEGNCLGKR